MTNGSVFDLCDGDPVDMIMTGGSSTYSMLLIKSISSTSIFPTRMLGGDMVDLDSDPPMLCRVVDLIDNL